MGFSIGGAAGIVDGMGLRTLRADSATHAIETIPHEHHEIHDNCAYAIIKSDPDLDNAEEFSIAFTTSNTTEWIHMLALAESTVSALWEILEAPTITVDTGTDITPYNRNRNSAETSSVLTIETVPEAGKATLNPTITVDGTVLESREIGGEKNDTGVVRADAEWMLKQNTTYAFRLTGQTNDGRATIALNWYEHTNKD